MTTAGSRRPRSRCRASRGSPAPPEIEPLVRSTVDPIAGIHGAIAVLAALAHRRRSGAGQLIEMPMVEVALNVAAEPIVTWSAYGTLLERQGNRGPNGAPQGVYACRGDEQWVAVSILTDDHWRSLCAVLGDPAWALDADLRDACRSPRAPRRRRPRARRRGSPNAIATTSSPTCSPRACTRHRCGTRTCRTSCRSSWRAASRSGSTTRSPGASGTPAPGCVRRSSTRATAAPAPTVGQHTADGPPRPAAPGRGRARRARRARRDRARVAEPGRNLRQLRGLYAV